MNLRHLTFRLLQVYCAVVRTGSISQAASQLHLTQPTVSLQIKRLTEAVGQPLLETREGRFMPTATGKALFNAAEEALARLEGFNDYLQQSALGQIGPFSIAIVTTAKYVLPRLLSPFALQFPAVEARVHIGNRQSILQRFTQQLDDIYVFSHPPTHSPVHSSRFLRNPLVLIAPPHHWAAQRSHLQLQELMQERFIMREPGSATRMVFEQFLRENNLHLQQSLQMESNEAIRMSVEAGLGLAVLSEHTLAQSSAPVAILKVQGFPLLSHWYWVRHSDKRLSPSAEQFLTCANAQLKNTMDARYLCE